MRYLNFFFSILFLGSVSIAQEAGTVAVELQEQTGVPPVVQEVAVSFERAEGVKGLLVGIRLGKPVEPNSKTAWFILTVDNQLPKEDATGTDWLPHSKVSFTPIVRELGGGFKIFAETQYERLRVEGSGSIDDLKNGAGIMHDVRKEFGPYLSVVAGTFAQAHWRDIYGSEGFSMHGLNSAFGAIGVAVISVKDYELAQAVKWKTGITAGDRNDGLEGAMTHNIFRYEVAFEKRNASRKVPVAVFEWREDYLKNGLVGGFGNGTTLTGKVVFKLGK